jgi:hypothetical protein
MATLQDVRDRLERAVGRLETAQRAYRDRQDARLAEAQREAMTANAGPDVEELVKALEETQKQNQALVDEREALADRVDAVIGRLQAVLAAGEGEGSAGGSAR